LISSGRRGFGAGLLLGLLAGVVAVVVAGLVGGWLDFSSDTDPVTNARQVIQDNYFHDPDESALNDASINGMVKDLRKRYDDTHSNYFNADELKVFEEQTSGRFAGVGLSVTEVPQGLRVSAVFPDTPAKEAGIKAGDVITGVDGKSLAGVSSEVSTSRIRGPIGTSVDLTVKPATGGKPEELTVKRASVRIPAVDSRMERDADGDKVGYVAFHTFSQGAHGELRSAIEGLYRRGAQGLVLDLRDNGGGLLDEAILCASIFYDHGNVVSTRSRTQGDKDYPAVGNDAIDPHPTAILTTRNTASAAEILSAALQQNHLAEIVGTRTYGKGTFQEVLHLPAGGALDLTIGEYLTANGTSILGKGVQPDVRVKDNPDTAHVDEGLEKGLQVVGDEIAGDQS
jgi:carboxyl-terminal processing protease